MIITIDLAVTVMTLSHNFYLGCLMNTLDRAIVNPIDRTVTEEVFC